MNNLPGAGPLTAAADPVLTRDPTATPERREIQFRAQRARTAFMLALFFNENRWKTLIAVNEFVRTIRARLTPASRERS